MVACPVNRFEHQADRDMWRTVVRYLEAREAFFTAILVAAQIPVEGQPLISQYIES